MSHLNDVFELEKQQLDGRQRGKAQGHVLEYPLVHPLNHRPAQERSGGHDDERGIQISRDRAGDVIRDIGVSR